MEEKETKWCGFLIRKRRNQLGWSQESLSHGICSVSYLSKIESAQALPNQEVLELLAKKLKIVLAQPAVTDRKNESVLFSLLKSGQYEQARIFLISRPFTEGWKQTMDGILLQAFLLRDCVNDKIRNEIFDMEPFLDFVRRPLWLLCCQEYLKAFHSTEEAWILYPALFGLYHQRVCDGQILMLSARAYSLASEQGYPHIMAGISHLQAIIFSNIPDYDSAKRYFERTRYLLEALKDPTRLEELNYNEACVALECRDYQKAIVLLDSIEKRSVMDVFKLSLAYELSSNTQMALSVLEELPQADYQSWDSLLIDQILELSIIRLKDPLYLNNLHYGDLLMTVFHSLEQSKLHKGFSQFYLPWVIQWLKANRQYAQIVSILENFPGKPLIQLP